MIGISRQYLIVLSVVLVMITSTCVGQFIEKTHVRVTNDMNGDLTVHCKSKNDDIGVKLLHPKGFFQFQFIRNFWRTTLYFCKMEWAGHVHWFDIYVADRDTDTCRHYCFWIVKPDGPCLHYPMGQLTCYPWNS
eukprot:XP_025012921.1 S-protein homolog 20-like [Ricinus communis]